MLAIIMTTAVRLLKKHCVVLLVPLPHKPRRQALSSSFFSGMPWHMGYFPSMTSSLLQTVKKRCVSPGLRDVGIERQELN